MRNVLQSLSYIQPHRHLNPPKAESILVLRGEKKTFYRLSHDSFNIGIDIEPGIFHTILATTEDTVLFEVKPGPYERSSDKDFASWAPSEGSKNSVEYLKKLYELTGPC